MQPRPPAQEDFAMKSNVGGTDRVLRILVGLALIGLTLSGTIGVWGWVGIVSLLTGLFRVCPLYTMLGLNTCPLRP